MEINKTLEDLNNAIEQQLLEAVISHSAFDKLRDKETMSKGQFVEAMKESNINERIANSGRGFRKS